MGHRVVGVELDRTSADFEGFGKPILTGVVVGQSRIRIAQLGIELHRLLKIRIAQLQILGIGGADELHGVEFTQRRVGQGILRIEFDSFL